MTNQNFTNQIEYLSHKIFQPSSVGSFIKHFQSISLIQIFEKNGGRFCILDAYHFLQKLQRNFTIIYKCISPAKRINLIY